MSAQSNPKEAHATTNNSAPGVPPPGSWAVNNAGDSIIVYDARNPDDEPAVAVTYDVDSGDRLHWLNDVGAAEAHARLIAAAPDLFNACHALYHAMLSYKFGNASAELSEEVAKVAQAAILKAAGPKRCSCGNTLTPEDIERDVRDYNGGLCCADCAEVMAETVRDNQQAEEGERWLAEQSPVVGTEEF